MEMIHLILFLMLCLGVYWSSSEMLKRQKRNWIIDSFGIDEGYKGPFPYTLGKIEVEKSLTFFRIHGQGVDKEPTGILKIDENTGVISVQGPVDYEKFKVLKLTFQALDRDLHVIDTQLGIEIIIIDANDNPPKFDREMYEIHIEESTSQGTGVVTLKASDDDSNEENRLFDFKIVSVTPKPQELEFFLTQVNDTATISFKGCLDHEKEAQYTIIVEAKDRGDKIQLSSSCTVIIHIEDGNNHLPEITGQMGSGRVKEGEKNVLVSRLQVTDSDSKGTAAWRAKYKIKGDAKNNFRISTDVNTNEGLLFVEKPLDFESSPLENLTISVENEIPYHTCNVVNRGTTGLWKVVTKSGATGTEKQGLSNRQVPVIVEDVNEPPFFDQPYQQVTLTENVKVGQYLGTFTARDPDFNNVNTFIYKKGDDPANWVTVDPKTGKITTSKIIDRESSFVKDNTYNITILAVDSGQPPMTGTATLSMLITDENDNAPFLAVSTIEMCQSDGHSLANITAFDLDEEPYGGPFTFQLQENENGKWKLDPKQGYSVNLVKEHAVHSGQHELLLEVFDLQGLRAVHNLSVTVCNCIDTSRPNCRIRKAISSTVGGGTLGIIFVSMLLLAGLLLLVVFLSCKRKTIEIPDGDSGQHLMKSNTEELGTDCKLAVESSNTGFNQNGEQIQIKSQVPAKKQSITTSTAVGLGNAQSEQAMYQTEILKQPRDRKRLTSDSTIAEFTRGNSMRRSTGSSSAMRTGNQHRSSMRGLTSDSTMAAFTRGNVMRWSLGSSSKMKARNQHRSSMRETLGGHRRYSADQENVVIPQTFLIKPLNKMLNKLQTPGEELGDYAPHVYAEEGDPETNFELDAISIPDISFDPGLDLDDKFKTLASICMPNGNAVNSITPPAQRISETNRATLIQVEGLK